MIEIKNLSKVFKNKKLKTKVTALNDIELTFPDSGMVFIIGKSGSGKTTLLNMIGGLDSPTTGQIICDGNELTKFNDHQYNKYRNSYVGFIFQDYHLLNELTVEQNIKFFLKKEDKDLDISNVLKTVGLEGYSERFPSQLSGGQRQRVAIARAIVKDANLILCDEPTGNLDKETSMQIIEILKELSKTKLVIVVSHNINECESYADRIIQLADGKIITDNAKRRGYKNELSIKNKTLIIPHDYILSDDDLIEANEALQNGEIKKIAQNDNGYSKAVVVKQNDKVKELKNGHISSKNIFKLFLSFLKTNPIHSIVTIIIASLIVGVASVFQSFLTFDGTKSVSKNIKDNDTPLILNKEYIGESTFLRSVLSHIDEEDHNNIRSTGYKDKIYNVYIPNRSIRNGVMYYGARATSTSLIDPIFTKEVLGVIECDKDFIKTTFNHENEIKYVALSDEIDPGGYYITDYLADSIMYAKPFNYPNYQAVLGSQSKTTVKAYVNGIIDTGYKQKFADLFSEIEDYIKNDSVPVKEKILFLQENQKYRTFINNVTGALGYAYYFDGSYVEGLKNSTHIDHLGPARMLAYDYVGEDGVETKRITSYNLTYNKDLLDNQLVMSVSYYNSIFGTTYLTTDANIIPPTKFSLRAHEDNDDSKPIIFEKEFDVVVDNKALTLTFSKSIYNTLIDCVVFPYSIALETYNNLDNVLKSIGDFDLSPYQAETNAIHGVSRGVVVLGKTFAVVLAFLIALLGAFIVGFSFSSIMNNKYQIGVIKALGGTTSDIGKIFVLKVIVIGLLTCITSVIVCLFLLPFANHLIISAFEYIYGVATFGLNIVYFNIWNILIFLALIFFAFFFGALVPLLFLKRVKPANIIKARE